MLNRRDFAKLSLTAAAAAATSPRINAATPSRQTIKPKRLTPGDTVGLVLPASAAFEADEIQFAKEQMEAIGFKVVIGPHAFDKWGYFAGRDRDRADDINRMFADDQIAGVVCYTGGWGSPRVLPYLDYGLIARKPKVLIGYSDITALLNAIHEKTGLITFHGPVGGSTFEPYTLENFRRVVMTAAPAGLLPNPAKKANELIDRTDRVLTTLALGGLFDHAAGIIFGRCSDCGVKGPSFSLEEILRDRFGSLPIPAISGLSFGHIEQKLVLPIGARATLDADAGTVRVEEGAV